MQKNKKNPDLSPEILKNLRFVLGFNKKEFAEEIKVSGRYYAMLEDGGRNPSEETAALILKKWGNEIAQIREGWRNKSENEVDNQNALGQNLSNQINLTEGGVKDELINTQKQMITLLTRENADLRSRLEALGNPKKHKVQGE